MKKNERTDSNNRNLRYEKKIALSFLAQIRTKDLFLMLYDLAAVTGAYFFALWFRFDCRYSEIPNEYLMSWLKFTPIYAIVSIVVFGLLHLYQSIWKYASFVELKRIVCASGILAVIHTAAITLLFQRMPISYYVIGATVQFVLIAFVRFFYRFISLERRKKAKLSQAIKRSNVMLIGAGSAGQTILRDLQHAEDVEECVCCIIDDDKKKARTVS